MTVAARDLTSATLQVLAAVRPDGGEAVRAAAATALASIHAFDAAELLIQTQDGTVRRWPIGSGLTSRANGETDPDAGLCGGDLITRLDPRAEPVRIDDPRDGEFLPETVAAMRRRGMGSLLAVPFPPPMSRGGVLLARRYAWAFVGLSLRSAVPLIRAIGVCHELAVRLTLFADANPQAVVLRETDALRDRVHELERELAEVRQASTRLDDDLRAAQDAARSMRAELTETRAALSAAQTAPSAVRSGRKR